MLTCSAFSVACTELLIGGQEFHFGDEGGGGAGGEVASSGTPTDDAACADGLTKCDSSCVDLDSDALHCGACAHDCAGATCSAGLCETEEIVSGVESPSAIALDDEHVYWTTNALVQRAPKSGGPIETLADAQKEPAAIAVDETFVFWVNRGNGKVVRLPKAGGAEPETIFAGVSADNLNSLALDGDSLYFTRKKKMGDVRRAKKSADSDSESVFAEQPRPTDVVPLGNHVLWSGYVESSSDDADADDANFRRSGANQIVPGPPMSGGYVRAAEKRGGAITSIAWGEGEITGLVMLGDLVVWADGTNDVLRARRIGGDEPAVTLASTRAVGLAGAGEAIVWSTSTGSVRTYEIATSSERLLAIELDGAGPLTADATHVYVLKTGAGGAIVRVAR